MSDASPPRGGAARVEDLIGRISVVARRLARPVGLAGRIGLVAGLAVWLLLPAPLWPEPPSWWASALSLLVLLAPGAWLVVHRRWLDRAVTRASTLAPDAVATAQRTYGSLRPGERGTDESEPRPRGRLRRIWRFYRETVSPVQGLFTDALGVTAPFRPYTLAVSGVALALVLVLLVAVPVAVVVRVALVVT